MQCPVALPVIQFLGSTEDKLFYQGQEVPRADIFTWNSIVIVVEQNEILWEEEELLDIAQQGKYSV